MGTETTRKLFTVDEYYRMAGAVILQDDVRTELIEGEILEMSAMGSLHAAVVSLINETFVHLFKGQAQVRSQLPIRLDMFSEPQPDIALVRPAKDFYKSQHPQPSEVLLIVEISDSSLAYDLGIKMPLYAAAGIPEVWIADLTNDVLFVFRNPSGKSYLNAITVHRNDSVHCLAFPETIILAEQILR